MRRFRAALWAVAALCVTGAGAGAQTGASEGWVLPTGLVRVGIGADYSHFDRRFGAQGSEWGDLIGPLDASTLAPLNEVHSGIDAFLSATGGGSVLPEELTLGDADIHLSADARVVPMVLAVGLLPRVELGVSLPFQRSELLVSRFAFFGATVAPNPDPEANAAAFAAVGPEFEALGRSLFLPRSKTALGVELIRRVEAAGGRLVLPRGVASDSLLQALIASELGAAPLESRRDPWGLGDAEATLKIQLISSMGPDRFPTEPAAFHYRVSGTIGARLPTGSESDTVRFFSSRPDVGLTGWSAGLAGDLFLGSRAWIRGGALYASVRPNEVIRRVPTPGGSLAPRTVTWTPPSELRLRLSPRVRLADAISAGLEYEMLRLGESRLEESDGSAAISETPGGALQRVGGSILFSTLTGGRAGWASLPLEASISYVTDLSGPSGAPAASRIGMQGRIFHGAWGR
jgi:hypothetical protein